MKKSIFLIFAALPVCLVVAPLFAVRADIVVEVTDNGAGSQNTINNSSNTTTQTDQTNSTDITNAVSSTANTGDNTASGNYGEVSMTSGDVTTQTSVANNANSNTVVAPCCENSLDVIVSGNGADSVNTIQTQFSTATTVNVTQIATITNTIHLNANTGDNTASYNNGDVEIRTGNIKAEGTLQNQVNQTQLTVGAGEWNIHIINRDNGVDSTNVVYLNFVDDLLLWRNDVANVNNQIFADLNTGRNTALSNLENVLIDTGNIDFSFDVVNGPINIGGAEVICCEDGAPIDDPGDHSPQPGIPPGQTSNSNSSGSPSGGSHVSSADVLGALASILPQTGTSALHFWIMAVVYLLIFLSGLYLRLRAGRSPNAYFYGYRLLAY